MHLKLTSVTKSYGQTMALDDFSAEFHAGVYGLLGPNGAGKTTLMQIITGNLRPDQGRVCYNGQPIAALGPSFREKLGYMPQQQNLYDQFSARRFLWYMAALKGMSRHEAKARIETLLALVGLEEEAHRRLGAFSGGMKQRVLIAQALLADPAVLLLDEPTAGLDPQERIRIRNFISEIALEKIVILATHVVSDIEFIAREVLLLRRGKLLQKEDPAGILDSMQGKVFEIAVNQEDIPNLQKRYRISNLVKSPDAILVRLISDVVPEGYTARPVPPSLEDVYLYKLEDRA